MASNKITKKDLNEMAVRSMAEQCCFSFERMQAVGFCYGMTKCFRKIHGDNNEEMAAAMANNLDFINTEPHGRNPARGCGSRPRASPHSRRGRPTRRWCPH